MANDIIDKPSGKIINDNVIMTKIFPLFDDIAKDNSVFKNFQRQVQYILDKKTNQEALNDSVIGLQILINDNELNKLFDIMKADMKQITELYFTSKFVGEIPTEYGKTKGVNQVNLITIPFLGYSLALYKNNKIREAKFVYLMAYMRAYASAVSKFFGNPYSFDKDSLQYKCIQGIINMHPAITNKYKIKKLGQVSLVIEDTSSGSFDLYIPTLAKMQKLNKYTPIAGNGSTIDGDYYVCSAVINSGITTRMQSIVKGIASIYYDVYKNPTERQKYILDFKNSTGISTSEDSEGTSYSIELNSIAYVKTNIVKKTIISLARAPIDEGMLTMAVYRAYDKPDPTNSSKLSKEDLNDKYGPRTTYNTIVRGAIYEIVTKKRKELETYCSAILDSYMLNLNANGQKRIAKDLKSPEFIVASEKIFKSPNSNDPNILKVREMTADFLDTLSPYYQTHKNEGTRLHIKIAVFMYFVWVLFTNARGS